MDDSMKMRTRAMNMHPLLRRLWSQRWLFLFLLPGFASFLLFTYVPLYGNIAAFQKYNPVRGIFGSEFAGLENFRMIFALPSFRNALRNTIAISLAKLLICSPAPILFALMLNELRNLRFKKTVQTISYLPYFVSWVVASSLWYEMLSPNGGMINEALYQLRLIDEPVNFMIHSKYIFPMLIFTELWKNLGWNSIIYLAALTAVNPELYEAAKVDGAGKLRQIWHISLPGIKPTVALMFIMNVANLLNAGFDQIYTMSNPVVLEYVDILDTLILRTLTVGGMRDLSMGVAVGIFKSAFALGLFLIANQASRTLFKESLI
jgi:putative aldouronate transport system permease protein